MVTTRIDGDEFTLMQADLGNYKAQFEDVRKSKHVKAPDNVDSSGVVLVVYMLGTKPQSFISYHMVC